MSNSEYKTNIINDFDSLCRIINPYKIIDTVAHYSKYLESAYKKHELTYSSSIYYRSAYNNLPNIRSLVGSSDIYKRFRSISPLVMETLINAWFKENNMSFVLPKGCNIAMLKFFGNNVASELIPVKEDTTIYLGTKTGNATFKLFVESYVIPRIKRGLLGNEIQYQFIRDNKFIQSLIPNIYSKNIDYVNSLSYRTSINMSPTNDLDIRAFELMLLEFNELQAIPFTVGNFTMSIKDIFYLYNLIAYNGLPGLGTLTRLFEDSAVGLSNSFNAYLSKRDWDEKDVITIDADTLSRTAAIKESKYTSYSKAIYSYNKNKMQVEYLEKDSEDGFVVSLDISKVNKNLFVGILNKPNYPENQFKYKDKTYNIEVKLNEVIVIRESTVLKLPKLITDNTLDVDKMYELILELIDYNELCK